MKIVEFADYSCPSCARVFEALQRLEKERGLEIEFKNLPLTHIHPDAMIAAEVAECARLQGKLAPMQQLLFTNREKLDASRVLQLAREAGLDIDRFKRDMTEGAALARIQSDIEEARALDIRGTPCVYVDGKKFNAEATYESLSSLT
jgi:protein-disulfide isomerase